MYLSATERAGPPDVVVGRGDFGAVDDHAKVVHRSTVVIRLLPPHRESGVVGGSREGGSIGKAVRNGGRSAARGIMWIDVLEKSNNNEMMRFREYSAEIKLSPKPI